jgi:cation diffusion facilitator family transporter
MEKTNEQIAMRVSRNNIIFNLLLAVFGLAAGLLAHSVAMVSDAVNTIADIFSTIIVMIGIKLANRKPDKEHPYGHERFECVTAMILAAILLATGIGIGWNGIHKVVTGTVGGLEVPGLLALIAALVSVVVKESIVWYTRKNAKKIDSSVLMADAWHYRSDTLSSAGTAVGILGARLGLPILDPLVCLIICLLILKSAIYIFRDAVSKMTDKACDEQTVDKMHAVILAQESIVGIDLLKTRLFGDKIYVDVEICTDGSVSLDKAHNTAQCVHDVIEKDFPKVKHCMVHVNPVIIDAFDD